MIQRHLLAKPFSYQAPTTLLRCSVLFLGLTLASTSYSEELPLWELGLGVAVLNNPDYLGADETSTYVLPIPSIIYRGDKLRADEDGIRGKLFANDRLTVDISGGGSLPVDNSDNSAREGMDDLDPSFELGPALNYQITENDRQELSARLKLRALISVNEWRLNYEGWILNPELRWEEKLSPDLHYTVSLRALWGDSGYHAFFYDVPEAFATADRPEYRSDGGYGGAGVATGLHWKIDDNWRIFSGLSWYNIDGASFNDSPLVKQEHGLYTSFVVRRSLFHSKRRVPR